MALLAQTRQATGTVRHWYAVEGWGVLVPPQVEGTVFAHFMVVDGPGYRELRAGQPVAFTYTTPGQDGCDHTAQSVTPTTQRNV